MRFSDREIIKDMMNVMRTIENYVLNHEERFGIEERVSRKRKTMEGK